MQLRRSGGRHVEGVAVEEPPDRLGAGREHARQRAVDRVAGGVELHKPVGLAPVERRPDVSAYATARFRLGAPDRCQDGQDIVAPDPVDREVARTRFSWAVWGGSGALDSTRVWWRERD